MDIKAGGERTCTRMLFTGSRQLLLHDGIPQHACRTCRKAAAKHRRPDLELEGAAPGIHNTEHKGSTLVPLACLSTAGGDRPCVAVTKLCAELIPLRAALKCWCPADIDRIIWTKVSRGCQLGVKRKDGSTTNFIGFRDKARCDCLLLLACRRCEALPLLPAHTTAQASASRHDLDKSHTVLPAVVQDLENLQEATRASGKEIEVSRRQSILATDRHYLRLACRPLSLHEGSCTGGLQGTCMLQAVEAAPFTGPVHIALHLLHCIWQTAVSCRHALAQAVLKGVSWVPAGQADVHCGPQLGRRCHRWLHAGVQRRRQASL